MISPLVIMVPLYRYMQALGLTEIAFWRGSRLRRRLRADRHLDTESEFRRNSERA